MPGAEADTGAGGRRPEPGPGRPNPEPRNAPAQAAGASALLGLHPPDPSGAARCPGSQPQDAGQGRGDGGPRGGVHDSGDDRLLLEADDALGEQDLPGAAAGVELDRYVEELEDQRQREEDRRQDDQPRHAEPESCHQQDAADLRAEAGPGDDHIADDQPGRARGLLERVPGLVGGDAQGGQGATLVHAPGEAQERVARIVIVAQLARSLFDRRIPDPAGPQDPLPDRRTGQARDRPDPRAGGIGPDDPSLRPDGQEQARQAQEKIVNPEKHPGRLAGDRGAFGVVRESQSAPCAIGVGHPSRFLQLRSSRIDRARQAAGSAAVAQTVMAGSPGSRRDPGWGTSEIAGTAKPWPWSGPSRAISGTIERRVA